MFYSLSNSNCIQNILALRSAKIKSLVFALINEMEAKYPNPQPSDASMFSPPQYKNQPGKSIPATGCHATCM
jgi:hypothetical protein